MEKIAARTIIWSITASAASVFAAFSLLRWFEGSPDSDGPGLGIGLALMCGSALAVLLVLIFVATVYLGLKLYHERSLVDGNRAYVFYVGATYSVAGAALLLMVFR